MGNCIVVVQSHRQADAEQAIAGGTSTAPTYRGLAEKGLIRKDYLNGDTGTGGTILGKLRKGSLVHGERVQMLTENLARLTDLVRCADGRQPERKSASTVSEAISYRRSAPP